MRFMRVKALSRKRKAVLEAFMDRSGHPEGTLSYREAQGFIFTVACAPELVVPSEWLPEIFGGGEPSFDSKREAGTMLAIFLDLFNDSVTPEGMKATLPKDCRFRKDTMANLEPDAPVGEWCRGFVLGHHWLMDCWNEVLPAAWDEDMATVIMALSFFSSRRSAEAFVELSPQSGVTLEELAELMRGAFRAALTDYSARGHALFKALRDVEREEEEADEEADTVVRPGRNDPCTCGSGRKYKRCCGGHVH